MSKLTNIDYLLNSVEAASQDKNPFYAGYPERRRGLLNYVKNLECENKRLELLARTYKDDLDLTSADRDSARKEIERLTMRIKELEENCNDH